MDDEARDWTKIGLLASIPVGAVLGVPLGWLYGNSVIQRACTQPGATNLCGLTNAPAMPFYLAIGSVIGAIVIPFAVAAILGRTSR